ncbi:cupin domain-containing protein [Maricaulaceae bacterium EIL42A08]|nr:cupin domain-containing protein [Maricaulaceae bacterium EIL42A08]
MELNADFSKPAQVHDAQNPWRASPSAGVERKMLDRIGDEVARATTIVRFAEGSNFAPHTHGGGEEFIVLEGVFQDEHADYPVGSYVRNPPTSRHTPRSEPGCTIFVKLWQMQPEDRQHVVVDMNRVDLVPDATRQGVSFATLFEDDHETVRKERWTAGASVTLDTTGGAELLVLSGALREGETQLAARDWLRVPDGEDCTLVAGPEGAEIWIKIGHLAHVRVPQAA